MREKHVKYKNYNFVWQKCDQLLLRQDARQVGKTAGRFCSGSQGSDGCSTASCQAPAATTVPVLPMCPVGKYHSDGDCWLLPSQLPRAEKDVVLVGHHV